MKFPELQASSLCHMIGLSPKAGTLQKLALGTWLFTSLVGKEPDLVQQVKNFHLDIVKLALMHRAMELVSLRRDRLDTGLGLCYFQMMLSCLLYQAIQTLISV